MPSKMGVKVILRTPLPSDMDLLRKLRNDTELQHLLLGYPKLTGPDDTEAWLQRRMDDEHGLFKIITDETNQPYGFAQIGNVHRRGGIGFPGICIDPATHGRGLGNATLKQLVNLAFASLNLRKLMSEVRADLRSALAMNQRQGFTIVGTLHDHYFDGKTAHDVVLMERQLTQGDTA
jgi:RimJ/RimL family protein N-acetyltransferase